MLRLPLRRSLPALALLLALSVPALAQYPPEQAFAGSPAMDEFEQRLRSQNGLLQRFQWEVVRVVPGVVLIQKPSRDPEAFVAQLQERYGPFVQALGETLDQRYFADLPRLRGDFGYALFVAESQRVYVNLRREARYPGPDAQSAVTYEDLGLVVAYDRGFTGGRPQSFERVPVLRELVRETLRQRASQEALVQWPGERWLIEGLAAWHAWHEGDDPIELREPTLDPEARTWLEELAARPELLEAFLLPLEELRAAPDEPTLTRILRERSAAAGLEKPSVGQVADASRHLPLLHVAALGQVRPDDLTELVRGFLQGEADGTWLDRVLGGDAASRHGDFRDWVEATLTGRSLAVVRASTPAVADYASPEVALLPESTDDWLALALGIASSGNYEEADVFLALALEQEDVDAEAIAPLREHLATLRAARDSLLEDAVATHAKLRLPHEGKNVSVPVEAVSQGIVRFAENRSGLEELAVTAITPDALATALGRDAEDHGPAWTVVFARWLGGEERWERGADEEDPAQAALLARLSGPWAPLRERGAVARELDRMARLEPGSVEQAARIVEDLGRFLREHASADLTREKTEALTAMGARALETVYASSGLEERLAGEVQSLPDGRLRVTYTFDEPEELNDWIPVPGYLPERRAEKFEVPLSEEQSEWAVRAGNLEGVGQGCFRHALRWRSPMTLRYEILYGRPQPGQGELGTMLISICDDGEGSYVGVADVHDLETVQRDEGVMLVEPEREDRSVKSATTYRMVLTHDGEGRAKLERDGRPLREIDTLARSSGNVVLWLHSQMTLAVKQVQIEGWLETEGEDPGQRAWVDERLREMGLYR